MRADALGAPGGRILAKGQLRYEVAVAAMEAFVADRDEATPDELWWLEHEPVYTLGIAGRRHAFRHSGTIPVVETSRGGEITYHGPGQLVVYPLLDLRRLGFTQRGLVSAMEDVAMSIIGGAARRDPSGPGVFVGDRKVVSIGMRARRGLTSHGIAINVENDLAPFDDIDPCGHAGLRMTSLHAEGDRRDVAAIGRAFTAALAERLGWSRSMATTLAA